MPSTGRLASVTALAGRNGESSQSSGRILQAGAVAAVYRVFKGMEPEVEVKVPGYFGAWAKRFRWKEYAIAWDAYFNDIAATPRDEQTAAARREAVEQAEQLQTLIKQEIERLKEAGQRRRLWPGASEDRTADLSHLATALKDASAARLAALEGIAPDLD